MCRHSFMTSYPYKKRRSSEQSGLFVCYGKDFMYKILFFHATWCNPCKFFKQHFIDVIQKYVEVEHIDVDKNRQKVFEFDVKRTPTAILVDDEGEIERVGFKDLNRLILFFGGKAMKIKFTELCHDNYTGELYKVGTVVEFAEDRAKDIIAKGYAVEVKDEPKAEKKTAKKTKVKKAGE